MHALTTISRAVTDREDCVISLSEADVKKVFNQVNTHKAAGPDSIPGRILGVCTEKKAGIFPVTFNLSLSQSVIPTCFKMPIIIPVPKNSEALCHNDHCPDAITSVIMKCFERLVMAHINTIIPDILDPLQFAYAPTDP